MKESDILYENGDFWVTKGKKGYEVYQSGVTHSVRVAVIGWEGEEGLTKARAEADRRATKGALATIDNFEYLLSTYLSDYVLEIKEIKEIHEEAPHTNPLRKKRNGRMV